MSMLFYQIQFPVENNSASDHLQTSLNQGHITHQLVQQKVVVFSLKNVPTTKKHHKNIPPLWHLCLSFFFSYLFTHLCGFSSLKNRPQKRVGLQRFLERTVAGAEKELVLPIGDSHPNASNPNPNLAVWVRHIGFFNGW